MEGSRPKALAFDVFGTVVDWRSGVIRDGEELGREKGLDVDWPAFADAWRSRYAPSMDKVRRGEIPWANLDALHRSSLEDLLVEFGVKGLTEEEKEHFNKLWHRLDPWPDSVPGLNRLRERYILTPLSNGNVALLVDMAKRAGLPWDAILGAEVAQAYKPQPEAYLRTAEILAMRPDEVCLVAAHNSDLAAARACGLRTAFVPRPDEHGPGQRTDLHPEQAWDLVAPDFVALAGQLGV